ncbi:MAG: sulfotransferase domain-containing protein [Trueperaceae bacterium]|nr:MAG: sulfotransferase domain-containing protein [Trueperaceae bacterium]
MAFELPSVTRLYQNHHLDSTRWRIYRARPGDIIVSTSYKSGTTWMQWILVHLVFQGQDAPDPLDVSPWIGMRIRSLEDIEAKLEAQTHRRVIKSHLALDGLPYYPEVNYVIVVRDARDVFMSLYNHYHNYTEDFLARLNAFASDTPFPVCPDDIRAFWRQWMGRGWFEWEVEGYPFWGNLHHTKTYWDFRRLPNIYFVHYSDLLRDLEGEIRRLATFLEIPVTDEGVASVARSVGFGAMKADAIKKDADRRKELGLAPGEDFPDGFRGGETSFIHKGTNGRWREVLTEDDLALYHETVQRVLTPECARYVERGRLGG